MKKSKKNKKLGDKERGLPPPTPFLEGVRHHFIHVVKSGSIFLLAIGVSLVLVEAYLRFFPPGDFGRITEFEKLFQADTLLGVSLKPNFRSVEFSEGGGVFSTETNENGLRDPTWTGKNGRQIILGLGDSFLFGAGVNYDQTILAQLQKLLDQQFPGKVRVINSGVPGYSTNHELVYYAARGEALFDPDIVLLFFYINDLVLGASSFYNGPMTTHLWENISVPDPPKSLLSLQSEDTQAKPFEWYIPKFIRYLEQLRPPRPQVYEKRKSNKITLPPEALTYFRETRNVRDELFHGVEGSLNILKHKVSDNGARLVVVYIPTPHETEDGRARETFYRMYTSDVSKWDWDGANLYFQEMLHKNGIPMINLVPAFREHWRQTRNSLYFNGGGHLTPEGNRFMAEKIFPKLVHFMASK